MLKRIRTRIRRRIAPGPDFVGLDVPVDAPVVSQEAMQTARAIRGTDRPPAIMLHGIVPRSGTNFVGQIIALHSDVEAYPGKFDETPLLVTSQDIEYAQKRFLSYYHANAGQLAAHDFLALFGAAFLAHLHCSANDSKRVLVKNPSVQYLPYFYTMFPHENLIVLVRDGRDVVHSTIETWPRRNFAAECYRWKKSAELILHCHQLFSANHQNYLFIKYEDVFREPATFAREACTVIGLDIDCYPFDKLDALPVLGSSSIKKADAVTWKAQKAPNNFQPVGRWKKWPLWRKAVFKKIAGQTLIALGYSKDLSW